MREDLRIRLQSANRDLRDFLNRVDQLSQGTGDVTPDDLRALSGVLNSMAPDIDECSRTVSGDPVLDAQVRDYIGQLRLLQGSLEQVRCVMLARKAELDSARRHVQGLQGWVDAYRQTT